MLSNIGVDLIVCRCPLNNIMIMATEQQVDPSLARPGGMCYGDILSETHVR